MNLARRWCSLAPRAAAILLACLSGAAQADATHDARALARVRTPPLGLPAVPIPANNPLTAEKVALGRKLYFDRRLSHNRTMSCAMCHIPEQGFTNNEVATPVGFKGRSLTRNAPTTYNVAYQRTMFHDARDSSLENQVFGPLLSSEEMANPSVGFLLATIRDATDYAGMFEAAFGEPVDLLNIGAALASYQRTVISANSPFDRWYFGGDQSAVSDMVRQGFALFAGEAGCSGCHLVGDKHALFTDHALHNTGIGIAKPMASQDPVDRVEVELVPGVVVPIKLKPGGRGAKFREKDLGRMGITNNPDDLYAYKTPTLRNVALTAPYMHDGSMRTLTDVVQFYRDGGRANPHLDPRIKPLQLDDGEVTALVRFLESLTGDNVAVLIQDARSAPIGN